MVVVCLHVNTSVTLCEECGEHPAKGRFCSGKCRQKAHRKSPAHITLLKRKREQRLELKLKRFRDKYGARSLGIYGWSGPVASWVGSR